MAKSRTRAKADKAEIVGRKNLIINGGFDVWQRGTSFTSGTYTADRWKHYNSGGTFTESKQEFALGESPVAGVFSYWRLSRVSPVGTYWFSQRIEDVRISDGATLTFSFYAKASSAVSIPCRITQEFGTGGSAGVNITAQNVDLTTSWQRFALTFSMASLAGKTLGTGHFIEPVLDISATTETIDITGVQLELGSVATDFEHRSYGEELALCQRYYQQFDYTETYQHIGLGQAGGSAICYLTFFFLNKMRTPPTISHNGVGNFRINSFSAGQDEVCTNIIYDYITTYSARIRFDKATGDFTTNQNAYINTESGNNASFYIDAEL